VSVGGRPALLRAMPTLCELNVYPVKSCAGIPLQTTPLGHRGVPGDRGWMVVDPAGRFVSQRSDPLLSQIRVRLESERVVLEASGLSPLALSPAMPGRAVQVTIWNDTCPAMDAGDDAAAWLEQHLGRPVRLVQMDGAFERRPNPEWTSIGQLSFADAYPVLVISRGSLEDLNRRLPAPLRMNRFRPNLVVEGCAPFEEDRWRRIRVGGAILRLVKPCDRCATTTVEQETAAVGREPLRTLATFRRWDHGGVIFGQNAVVEVAGPVRVGDSVEVLERGEPPVLERGAPHPVGGGST
jgi:uncharacterized protein YcbX